VRKTENYKLAEALKDHSRDLLLLSARHTKAIIFQFWMLAQLLNPTLFRSPERWLRNRQSTQYGDVPAHQGRCLPAGWLTVVRATLGSHHESFMMAQSERLF